MRFVSFKQIWWHHSCFSCFRPCCFWFGFRPLWKCPILCWSFGFQGVRKTDQGVHPSLSESPGEDPIFRSWLFSSNSVVNISSWYLIHHNHCPGVNYLQIVSQMRKCSKEKWRNKKIRAATRSGDSGPGLTWRMRKSIGEEALKPDAFQEDRCIRKTIKKWRVLHQQHVHLVPNGC